MVVNKKNFISLVFSFCFFLVANISSAVAQDGPHNLGFENGESNWTRVSESESISVVGTQGADSSPTYADLGITVSPDKGSYMLSLGVPKQKSENMNLGSNAIRQTFNSYSDAIVLSFRLFSWEFREQDSFTIDVVQTSDLEKNFVVQDSNGGDLSVTMYEGQTAQICTATPCVLKPFSGKSGNLVNTGWKRVIVSGLPTDGSEVSISYDLEGVKDQGHPSWAYVDSWNNVPVANFTVSRESTIEGNVSRFIDKSTDIDPGDEITKRIWEISHGGGETQLRENAKEISVISSTQGTVTAKLKVFDRFGGSDTIQSDQTGPDGKKVPSIGFEDSTIFVNNLLSYNIVAGSKGNIITARYAKPGWDDQIDASWLITSGGGTLGTADNIQLPIPMMLKGMASIPFDAPNETGTTEISLTLKDPDGKSVSRTITVEIKPESDFQINQDADGNDSIAELGGPDDINLVSGTVTLGHLNKQGDVDYYRVTDANGNNFPVGSEVYVRLRNTTTDHDMFLVGQSAVISEEETDALARIYSSRLARIYSSRLARIYSSRLARVFSSRLARIYSSRLARIYSSRLARVYSARLARVYSSRLARIYSSRLARVYSSRLEEGDNQAETVVFTKPGAEYGGWEQAVADHLLHSMYFRDSDIDPFSTASINNGFNFEQFPLSESIFLPIPEGAISQKDIDINETALGDLSGSGYQVESFSANDGYEDEVMLVKIRSEDNTYIAVASDSGFGSPYSIQVENSIPTNLEHIATEACKGNPLVTNANNEASGLITTENSGDEVMYVVNPQRMAAKFGQSRWDSLYTELKSLAKISNGKILAIHELATYADMDTNPCQVEKANSVAQTIRNAITANRGVTDSVTLVGGDDILPFYRVLDPSDYTERDYVAHTELSPRTPMYSAMFNSYILTDKYYSNDYFLAKSTTKLLIPMWGVSRLVETPEEMLSAIEHHKANIASVEMNSAMVSAYDVVLDSGKDIYKTLSLSLYGHTNGGIDLIEQPAGFDLNKPWYATNIRCHMMGLEYEPGKYIPGCSSENVVDVVSLNGHFTHDTLISQAAYEEPTKCAEDPTGEACLNLTCDESLTKQECFESKYLTSQRVEASANGNISGNYVYSPGCHAGLNVPGMSNHTSSTQYGDFPSSYVSNGATYLAGTGYGIAGTNTNSFSEKLMSWNTKTLAQGGKVGMLAADADTFYMLERMNSGLSPYDIKAMYQSTLYGFANTKVISNGTVPLDAINDECDTYSSSSLNLSIVDGESDSHSLNPVCTESGVYYEGDAGTKSEIDRPIQPLTQITLTASENNVRGILIEEATYSQSSEPIDAVILTPTTDNDVNAVEQSFCKDSRYWPSKLVDHSYSEDGAVINFVSGQYVCDDQNSNTGFQRLYESATMRILRSDSTDKTPPDINSVDPQVNEQGNVIYYVDATDLSGINQIMLTIYLGDSIKTIKSALLSGDGPYELELNAEDSQLALNNTSSVTVIDGENNITISSSKGRGMKQVLVNIEESGLVSTLSSKQLSAIIQDYDTRKAASRSMSYIWDFGDGHFETGKVFDGDDINDKLIDNKDGTATFSTSHHYENDSNVTVKFKVTDSSGGIGSDTLDLRSCSDPSDFIVADADLVQCDVTSTDTQINIMVKVADGGTISSDVQYRLYLDYTNDGANDLKLTYDNKSIGKNNKVDGLIATVSDDKQSLLISFDLAPTGWTKDMPLNWYMETQSGVEKVKGAGSADVMPDTGYFSY